MVSDNTENIYPSRLRLRSAPVWGCPLYSGSTSGTNSTNGARPSVSQPMVRVHFNQRLSGGNERGWPCVGGAVATGPGNLSQRIGLRVDGVFGFARKAWFLCVFCACKATSEGEAETNKPPCLHIYSERRSVGPRLCSVDHQGVGEGKVSEAGWLGEEVSGECLG